MKRYCTYIFKKGEKKGEKCKDECHLQTNFCKKHTNKRKEYPNKIANQNELPTIIHINKLVNKKIQEESIRDRILDLPTDDLNKSIIFKHYNNMKRSDSNSTEYYKNQIFVDSSLAYPWSKFFNINDTIKNDSIKSFIEKIKVNLDKEIYGMNSVKNEIINMVCKLITNPSSERNNIALCGAAGVGKSKFIKVLSDTLGLPMKTISLGGVKDSSFFLGHGYVYVESGPGKILQNVIDSKISNPILYFDELDKVSETDNGKDIFSFLCYLTDPTQNKKFTDHYFYGMQFDLSKIFYVFTFNDIDKIDKILIDRLNIIQVSTPKDDDIIVILQKHCIPEIIKNIGIQKPIIFPKEIIKNIINYISVDKSASSGIREYYRIIEKILLELNKNILLNIDMFLADQEIVIDDIMYENLILQISDQFNKKDTNTYSHMYI
jgi:ATP-dependent Lon protease